MISSVIRPELLTFTFEQVRQLLPYIVVLIGVLLSLLMAVWQGLRSKWTVYIIALVTLLVSTWFNICHFDDPHFSLFNQMLCIDAYSRVFNIIFLMATFFTILFSFRYLDYEKLQCSEYYILMLFSVLGMMLMVSSLDLLLIFINLELMSLTVYVLVGFRKSDRRSNEAALKYFIMGAVASMILLYGVAMLYGASGSTYLKQIALGLQNKEVLPLALLGVMMLVFGLLFKVAAVPLHLWMPDVYEGAPVTVTGFMATALKSAVFAVFFRIIYELGLLNDLLGAFSEKIHSILWIIAVLTMLIGNWVALHQTQLKRLLAYSSIAHSGYLLVGMLATTQSSLHFTPVIFYLLTYVMMNLGIFVILTLIASPQDSGLSLHDLSGLSQRHPWLSFVLTLFVLSLAGIPPTAGFMAKYMIFFSAIEAGEINLVIIGVLCSATSVYYYFKILVYLYMREPIGSPRVLRFSFGSTLTLIAMVIGVVNLGVFPAEVVTKLKSSVIRIP